MSSHLTLDFDALAHDEQLGVLAELAESALARWDLPTGARPRLVNLSENATYRVDAPDGRAWALRIHREGYHSDTAIRSELAWMTALRADGVVATPVPVPGRDGALVQKVAHPAMPRPRNTVLSDWESGTEPGIGEDLARPFRILGETAARMHRHVARWRKPDWFERFAWDFDAAIGARPHWGRWRDGMAVDEARAALFGETAALIGRRLAAYGKAPERFGLTHCDLRLANLLVDGDAVTVLDFDDCGFSWLMYDAATPVSFFEHHDEVPELIDQWLDGYRRVIDLPDTDAAEIPTFVMLRRLLLVAWIGSHSETELARAMGVDYTRQTDALCRDYLRRFG